MIWGDLHYLSRYSLYHKYIMILDTPSVQFSNNKRSSWLWLVISLMKEFFAYYKMSESRASNVLHWHVPYSEFYKTHVWYLAFLWVTRVLSGQMTARNLSQEMAERVITLDTIHSTDTWIIIIIMVIIISVVTNSKIWINTEYLSI